MADGTPPSPQSGPHTPAAKESDYLPSPPITPICKRSIKSESFFQFDDICESSSSSHRSDVIPPISQVRRGRKPGPRISKRGRIAKPRSKATTTTTKKLSVRRKFAATHKIPKRIGGAKPTKVRIKSEEVDAPMKIKSEPDYVNPRPPKKLKVKFEPNDVVYQPSSSTSKQSTTPKRPNKSGVVSEKKKVKKGRTTYNSLAATIHPTIHKRKYKPKNFTNTGKICGSYYPSNPKIRPNAAGDRYYKGKPYHTSHFVF